MPLLGQAWELPFLWPVQVPRDSTLKLFSFRKSSQQCWEVISFAFTFSAFFSVTLVLCLLLCLYSQFFVDPKWRTWAIRIADTCNNSCGLVQDFTGDRYQSISTCQLEKQECSQLKVVASGKDSEVRLIVVNLLYFPSVSWHRECWSCSASIFFHRCLSNTWVWRKFLEYLKASGALGSWFYLKCPWLYQTAHYGIRLKSTLLILRFLPAAPHSVSNVKTRGVDASGHSQWTGIASKLSINHF